MGDGVEYSVRPFGSTSFAIVALKSGPIFHPDAPCLLMQPRIRLTTRIPESAQFQISNLSDLLLTSLESEGTSVSRSLLEESSECELGSKSRFRGSMDQLGAASQRRSDSRVKQSV